MIKEYWYWYQCAPSSETRGRRAVHDGGCGHWNVQSSNTLLDGRQAIQASPCANCGRRMRLNRGIVRMIDWETTGGQGLDRFKPLARRRIAREEAEYLNSKAREKAEEKSSVGEEE